MELNQVEMDFSHAVDQEIKEVTERRTVMKNKKKVMKQAEKKMQPIKKKMRNLKSLNLF
jgi:hypothetical protein